MQPRFVGQRKEGRAGVLEELFGRVLCKICFG